MNCWFDRVIELELVPVSNAWNVSLNAAMNVIVSTEKRKMSWSSKPVIWSLGNVWIVPFWYIAKSCQAQKFEKRRRWNLLDREEVFSLSLEVGRESGEGYTGEPCWSVGSHHITSVSRCLSLMHYCTEERERRSYGSYLSTLSVFVHHDSLDHETWEASQYLSPHCLLRHRQQQPSQYNYKSELSSSEPSLLTLITWIYKPLSLQLRKK